MSITKNDVVFEVDVPKLILLCGPCRTGTTALSNIFVRAGIESHMQPIKSMRRAKESGDTPIKWVIKNNPSGLIFSKETFGESHQSEFFNPVDDLVPIGYPKEKIHVILLVRDPKQTFGSWRRMWGDSRVESLNKAFCQTEEIRLMCLDLGVEHSVIVHEAIKSNDPNLVATRLFKKIGLDGYGVFVDWHDGPKFGDDSQIPNLVFYDSPPEKFISGVRNRGGYRFAETPIDPVIDSECGAYPDLSRIYNLFLDLCEKELNIKINTHNS